MKIVNLFSDFRPCLKCGAEAVIPFAGSMVSGMYQAHLQQENVNNQLSVQQRENQKNRDWQTIEAEKSRDWQAGQILQQNQFQTDLAAQQQQYNLQSMKQQAYYNSPAYMSQQLRNANINPQVYFGNHSGFVGSSALSGGAPSAPSSGHGSSVGSVQGISPVSYQPALLNPVELFKGVSEALNQLGQAKKQGVETDFLERSLQDRLRQAFSAANLQEIDVVLRELDSKFQKSNFDIRVKHAIADYKKTLGDIDLLSEKTLTEKQEQALKESTRKLNESIQALNEKEREKLGVIIPLLPRILESQILESRGSAAAAFAKANESNVNSEVLRNENRIRKIAADIKEGASSNELKSVIDDLIAKSAISEEQYAKALVEIMKVDKIRKSYKDHDSKLKVDATIENCLKILGVNIGATVHN